MDLKRDLVKYVRDKAKSKYKKDAECYICGEQENLDFHHFYGLTELLEMWLRRNKIHITQEQEILALREQFIKENECLICIYTHTFFLKLVSYHFSQLYNLLSL